VTRFLSTAFNLAKNMGPEGKIAAGWMAAALWAGAGAYGLPFTQDLEKGGDLLWQKITGTDPMIDAHLRQFLSDAGFGKTGSEVLLRGPLSVALGVDLSSRLGFGDIISRIFGGADFMGTIPSIMLGRLNAAYEREQESKGQGLTGHMRAGAELLPAALRNPAKAEIQSETGIPKVKAAADITGGDIVRQALGITPLSVEEAYTKNAALERLPHRYDTLRENTVSSVAQLLLQSRQASGAQAQEITSNMSGIIADYNKDHKQAPITAMEIRDAVLERANPELYRRMKVPKAFAGEAMNSPYP
jgi:hypothetical protein